MGYGDRRGGRRPGEPPELLEWPGGPGRRARVFSLTPGAGHLASLAVLTGRPVRVRERDADQLLREGRFG